MAKIGEKEAQRRAQRELAFEGAPYRSRASSVAGLPVKVVEGAPPGSVALVPPRRADETDAELAGRSVLIKNVGLGAPVKPKKKRAPKGTFDRKAYQRELMRKRRAEAKSKKSGKETV